jgi:hypothetical protein
MKSPPRLVTIAASFGVFILTSGAALAADDHPASPIWHISNLHQHPWFAEVICSSVAGWLLGMVKGFSSSGDWLRKYLPSKPAFVVFLLDLLIFVVFGGYFGTGIYNPTNLLAAFAAGLSWPVGLGALATKET